MEVLFFSLAALLLCAALPHQNHSYLNKTPSQRQTHAAKDNEAPRFAEVNTKQNNLNTNAVKTAKLVEKRSIQSGTHAMDKSKPRDWFVAIYKDHPDSGQEGKDCGTRVQSCLFASSVMQQIWDADTLFLMAPVNQQPESGQLSFGKHLHTFQHRLPKTQVTLCLQTFVI